MFNLVQPMFNPFGVARTIYGQLWPYLTKKGHFWGVLGPPSAIFGGQKGSKLTPPDVKYNVQPCSTNVQPIWGCWECLWPNMAILGQKWPFRVFLMVITDPPGCKIICSTMSNQSSTYLGSLGLPMAQYVNFRSFWGALGPPSATFGGQNGTKLTPQM